MVDALDVHDAVLAKLKAVTGLVVFDGEVPATPPLDADGRVGAYAVLYASPGDQFASALNGVQASLSGSFQITCAGGDLTRALWSVRKVRAGLLGPVTVAGRTLQVRAREGADPGVVRRDEKVSPPRHYVPVEFFVMAP